MVKYTIADFEDDECSIRRFFSEAKNHYRDFDWSGLDKIFEVALLDIDRFPNINLRGVINAESYIERWVRGYYDATDNLPSQRSANPKSSCNDPAIKAIVKVTRGLSEEEVAYGEQVHNLFMSAENVQGNLLEEYISNNIRDYGFLWCRGNVLRAIDFCNDDGTLLLQIKNKSNTENSSSTFIRSGTDIKKWYRLGTKTLKGEKCPVYKWDALNNLINKFRKTNKDLPLCAMSEESYQLFLREKASENNALITEW